MTSFLRKSTLNDSIDIRLLKLAERQKRKKFIPIDMDVDQLSEIISENLIEVVNQELKLK